MTIEDKDVIDAFGIDRESGAPCLTIADHLQWSPAHLSTLESKLDAYVRFIESGQIAEHTTSAVPPRIWLVAMYRPSATAMRWLAQAQIELSKRGINFQYGPHPDSGYADGSS